MTTAYPPLALHPENPHYLLFRGKPTTLITSAEHYGAVMNPDFDFIPYLDALAACEFNLTRLFSGTYRELPGSHAIQNNTMAPESDRYLCPWLCVERDPDGAALTWDLAQWDDVYWSRLRDFVAAAGERGVVVEYVLFCFFYADTLWEASPMHPTNNVNGVAVTDRNSSYTLENTHLLAIQDALARKAAAELADFDNVYFEVINEAYSSHDGDLTLDWQHHIVDTLVAAEADLPQRHLIAINYQNRVARIADLHPDVDIINFHYATPEAAAWNYHLDRPMADDETGFKGSTCSPYRTEAWAFMLSGGAVLSHLDYSFTVASPEGLSPILGTTPGHGGPEWRAQLTVLKRFLDSLDLIAMAPTPEAASLFNALHIHAAVMAEVGKAYAVYLWGGGPNVGLNLALPAGDYHATWINPVDGKVMRMERVDKHTGGGARLRSPIFHEDIALKVVRA